MRYAILLHNNKVLTKSYNSGLFSSNYYTGGKLPYNFFEFPSEDEARDVASYCSSLEEHIIRDGYKILKLKEVLKVVNDGYVVDEVL